MAQKAGNTEGEGGAPIVHGPVVVASETSNRRRTIVVAACLVLVVAAAVAGWLVWRAHNANSPQKVATPQQKYQSLDKELQKQFDDGHYDQTIKDINDYLATDPPKEYVKQVTVQQAAAYLNTKDYPNALIWYRKALDMSNTPFERMAALHGLAFTYEESGDTAAAIEQYKAAYAIAKPMSTTNNQALRLATDDEFRIKRLGGSL